MKLHIATLLAALGLAIVMKFAYGSISTLAVPLTTGPQNYGKLINDNLSHEERAQPINAIAYSGDPMQVAGVAAQLIQASIETGMPFGIVMATKEFRGHQVGIPASFIEVENDLAPVVAALKQQISHGNRVLLLLPFQNGSHRVNFNALTSIERYGGWTIPVVDVGRLLLKPETESAQDPICDRSGSDDVGDILDLGCLMLKRSHIEQLAHPDLTLEHATLERVAPNESILLVYKP